MYFSTVYLRQICLCYASKKSLLLLTIHYHYFRHLDIQKCCQRHILIQVRSLLHISLSNTVAHPNYFRQMQSHSPNFHSQLEDQYH